MIANQLQLSLRGGLGEEIVDARLRGDRRGRQPVVAGNHDRLDAHVPKIGEPLLDAAFDDILRATTPSTRTPSQTTSGVLPVSPPSPRCW